MTDYATIYPSLKKELDTLDNFDVVCSTITKYFPDLFKLSAIDIALQQDQEGHYLDFAKKCSAVYQDFIPKGKWLTPLSQN